jgi:hypothetical protein
MWVPVVFAFQLALRRVAERVQVHIGCHAVVYVFFFFFLGELCCVRERAMSSASGTLVICGLVCDKVAVRGCWALGMNATCCWALGMAWMLPVQLCYSLRSTCTHTTSIQYNRKEWRAKKLAQQSSWSINWSIFPSLGLVWFPGVKI